MYLQIAGQVCVQLALHVTSTPHRTKGGKGVMATHVAKRIQVRICSAKSDTSALTEKYEICYQWKANGQWSKGDSCIKKYWDH